MSSVTQSDIASDPSPANIDQTFTLNSGSNLVLLGFACMNNNQFETVSLFRWNDSENLSSEETAVTEDDARVEFWLRVAPSTGNHTLECDFSATMTDPALVGYIVVDGVDQASPVRDTDPIAAQGGAGTGVSGSVTTVPGDLVIMVVCGESVEGVSWGAGQTEIWNSIEDPQVAGASYKVATGTSTSMSATLDVDDHRAAIIVSLRPAAAGGAFDLDRGIARGILRGIGRGI